MRFDEFILILEKRINSNKNWITIHNKIPFTIDRFDGDYFYLILQKETDRKIKIDEFEEVWNLLKGTNPEKRFIPNNYKEKTKSRNLSYILAMIERTIWD